MNHFQGVHRPHLGLVSAELPLISNLSVWANIALIPQYHENTPWKEAKKLALDLLNRFGLAHIAEQRNSSLTPRARFSVMVIRAAMVHEAVVVLDRPFRIVPDLPDGRYLADGIEKVADLIADAHIFDYNWEKERYRMIDAAED